MYFANVYAPTLAHAHMWFIYHMDTKKNGPTIEYRAVFKWMAVFILEDELFVWTNLVKHSLFVGLYVSSIKTGARRIIRLDELSSVVRLERRTK